jgi:hypothetical protein
MDMRWERGEVGQDIEQQDAKMVTENNRVILKQ